VWPLLLDNLDKEESDNARRGANEQQLGNQYQNSLR
jgi:hypothetical protein